MVEYDYEGSNHTIVTASKEEGYVYADVAIFHLVGDTNEKDKIDELRERGYKIFTVFKQVGVVDDIVKQLNK